MRYNAVFPRSEQGTGFQWFDSSQHHNNPLIFSGLFLFITLLRIMSEKLCIFLMLILQ